MSVTQLCPLSTIYAKAMNDCPTLYIVSPCFNEQEVLPETNRQLTAMLKQMIAHGAISASSRITYVSDGSTDNTWPLICSFADMSDLVCGIKLAGNSGHQNALIAGLSSVKDRCDIMITIDADMQDDISVIPAMVENYRNGCDIVYGVRNKRQSDTFFKRTSAQAFYRIMRKLGVKTIYNHADYRLMSRRAVCQLLQYNERNIFLRGIVPLIGYKTARVYYDRSERQAGTSKYPFSKMANFAIDGITSFSIKPVRLVLSLGLTFLVIALCILVYVLYSYFSGRAVSGWSSMILSIWIVGGFILIGLGVVGEYIGKIYIEVKNRPRYNIEETILK